MAKEACKYFWKKGMKSFDEKSRQLIDKEYRALQAVAHPRVVRCFDHGEVTVIENGKPGRNAYYLVLEYISGGSLFDLIHDHSLSIELTCHIFKEIVTIMQHISSRGYAHLDIKLENIMIAKDGSLTFIDFGLSEPLPGVGNTGRLQTYVGTPTYKSPEILQSRAFIGTAADVFSVGVVLFALIANAFPFEEASYFNNYYKHFVKADPSTYWNLIPRTGMLAALSPELESLISLLFEFVPESRITIPEILQHPWILKTSTLAPADAKAQIRAFSKLP